MTGPPAVDRTPKACLHKRANHQHGTYACYGLDSCRCLRCCYAASVYEHNRTKRNAYGRSNYIDADPARRHVAALMAAGVGLKRIVTLSGVPQGALWKLMYGKRQPDGTQQPSRRVTRVNAERLLALRPGDPALLADGARIDPTGTRRRLQALACLGWSIGRIAAETGIDRQALDGALHGRQVTAAHARAVAATYERLWNQPPPSGTHPERIAASRSLNRAKASGWLPPAAWDDDTIDDPTAQPFTDDTGEDLVDEPAVAAVLDGYRMRLTGATPHAAVHALAAAGHQPTAIAARLGIDERQVARLRGRDTAPRPHRGRAA